ncbi:MAG: hypothetical protein ABJF04_19935 [Reichenbachiella sp.]|uniref:hypothetical protein n=2 Tax=Reichenbachiella sp. TaxID=2184521 RepID=UPI00326665F1
MIKINQYLNAIFYGLILMLFSMCNTGELDFDDIKTPNLQSNNSVPIGQTTYTIKELIEKLEDPSIEITEDNTKLLSIAYRDTLTFNDYLTVIQLEDISNPGVIQANSTPIAGSPSDQDVLIPTQNLSFEYSSPNNEELDSVKYSAGTITLDIQNGYATAIEYELTLNDVVNLSTGNPMVLSGTLPASGSDNISESLIDHKTIVNYDGSKNLFTGQFNGILKVKTGDFINGTEFINYTLTITGADFSEIFGWFGNKNIAIESKTISVDFFDGISENSVEFGDPQINFLIDNSFGVPMGLNLDGLSSSNANGVSVNLSGDITATPQLVRAPSTSQVGTTQSSIIEVNNTNSNLPDLLAISPNQFAIDVSATANYNNDSNTGDRNFVSSSSAVQVITEINLPLNLKLQNLSRDFGTGVEGFDFEDADTIRLILTTVNQLPIEGTITMQFLAADSSVLHEKPDIAFLQSPEVPISGRIEEPITAKDTVTIFKGEGNGYQELLDASILNIVTNITSYQAADGTYVKIFSDYELILKVGVQANTNYEF